MTKTWEPPQGEQIVSAFQIDNNFMLVATQLGTYVVLIHGEPIVIPKKLELSSTDNRNRRDR
jgi:hypothetical protein